MRYEGPVYRPPCEAESYILQATIGCPYNRCTFCVPYKQKTFRRRPLEEVKEDVDMALRAYGPAVTSVFIADGNSIIMPTDYAVELLDYLHATFPRLEHVGVYGGAKYILKKRVDELRRLREHGLSVVYMGMESGHAEVLRRLRKGMTPEDMIAAALRMKEAELPLSVYVLFGAGGRDLSQPHAEESARVLSAMDPLIIRPRTLNIRPGTPLEQEWRAGLFELPGRHAMLLETQTLLMGLEVTDSWLVSDHATNYLPLYGHLPEDKQSLLAIVAEALAPFRDQDPDWTPAVGRGSEQERWGLLRF